LSLDTRTLRMLIETLSAYSAIMRPPKPRLGTLQVREKDLAMTIAVAAIEEASRQLGSEACEEFAKEIGADPSACRYPWLRDVFSQNVLAVYLTTRVADEAIAVALDGFEVTESNLEKAVRIGAEAVKKVGVWRLLAYTAARILSPDARALIKGYLNELGRRAREKRRGVLKGKVRRADIALAIDAVLKMALMSVMRRFTLDSRSPATA